MNKAKFQHVWTVLCTQSITDQEANTITLVNVIDQITIDIEKLEQQKAENNGNLNIPVNLELVSFFNRLDDWKSGEFTSEIEFDLLGPDQKILHSGKFPIHFPKGYKRIRFRAKINAIKLTTSGEYMIVFKSKMGRNIKEITRIPLEVMIRDKDESKTEK